MGWFNNVMNTQSANDKFWDKQKTIDKQNSKSKIINKIKGLEESMDIGSISGQQRTENMDKISYWKKELNKL